MSNLWSSELWSKIFLAIIAATVGAWATYFFSAYGKAREEAQKQRTESYLSYLKTAEGDDIPLKIYTRSTVLAFGSSTVIKSMAEALRAHAVTLAGDKREQYIKQSTDGTPIMPWVHMFQNIRGEYNSHDPISDQDVLTIMCPDPTIMCYRVWYSDHLFGKRAIPK